MLLDKTDDAKIEKIVQQAGCFLYMVDPGSISSTLFGPSSTVVNKGSFLCTVH